MNTPSITTKVYQYIKTQSKAESSPEDLVYKFHSLLKAGELQEFGLKSDIKLDCKLNKDCAHTVHGTINIVFARLSLSPSMIDALGEENIEKAGMTIEKLGVIKYDGIIEIIRTIGGENIASEHLTEEALKILNTDGKMLDYVEAIGGTNIATGGKNIEGLLSLKEYLRSSQIKAMGGKYFVHEGMTPDKLQAIGKHLTEEQIIAIGGEFLADEKMTSNKIQIIGEHLTSQQIHAIGGSNLINIEGDKKALNTRMGYIGRNLDPTDIKKHGGENIVMMSIAELRNSISSISVTSGL